MAKLEMKYRLEGKALPPRPIKVAIGDWGGSAEQKKVHGSRPEAWHCPAFTDAFIHGFELLYQYAVEMEDPPRRRHGDAACRRACTQSTGIPSRSGQPVPTGQSPRPGAPGTADRAPHRSQVCTSSPVARSTYG